MKALITGLITGMTLCLVMMGIAQPTFAGEKFRKAHPRRAEVNARERRQDARINAGEKSGKITQAQGDALKQNVANVKAEERADVKANGGHLTKDEKVKLNQELNQNSKEIRQEKSGAQAQ